MTEVALPARWLKVTSPTGEPIHGGDGQWPLPRLTKAGRWVPGRWWRERDVALCVVGLHLTDDDNLEKWVPRDKAFTVWLAEGRGGMERDGSKAAFREARLLEPLVTMDEGMAQEFHRRVPRTFWTVRRMQDFVAEIEATLARPGIRVVFGQHRAPGAYCPAWPSPRDFDHGRVTRMLRESRRILGIPQSLDRAVRTGDAGAYAMAASWRRP